VDVGYLISKPPGGPPLFWHQDWWGWDQDLSYTSEYPQLFFMYYLTDTTPEKGAARDSGFSPATPPAHDLPKAHDRGLASYQSPDDPAYADHPRSGGGDGPRGRPHRRRCSVAA
jgi:hypothetical protein